MTPQKAQQTLSKTSAHPVYRSLIGALGLCTLVFGLLACSAGRPVQRWNEDFLQAARLQDQRQFDEAEQHYVALRARATTDGQRRQIDFELANITLRRGDKDGALAAYKAIWDSPVKDSVGGRALHESARIVAEKDLERALLLHRTVITEYPEHVAADFSLSVLRIHYGRTKEHHVLLELLDALYAVVAPSSIANHILFTRAVLLETELRDEDGALETYTRLYRGCDGCSLGDEALWQMAQIYVRRQHWQPAITILEALAARVETSWFVGTYNSPRAGDSRYQLGMICMLHRNDYDRASEHFELYIKTFPHNVETDDAAWHLVQIERLRGQTNAYQQGLLAFEKHYPDSRHVATARARLGSRP
ncbi:MAG: tetratricopeptide repeat protein [Bradymonadaceae bacterium]|nr:tetratricopeptide repeat protein [Lujinxingiaceae bacterium]